MNYFKNRYKKSYLSLSFLLPYSYRVFFYVLIKYYSSLKLNKSFKINRFGFSWIFVDFSHPFKTYLYQYIWIFWTYWILFLYKKSIGNKKIYKSFCRDDVHFIQFVINRWYDWRGLTFDSFFIKSFYPKSLIYKVLRVQL